MHHHKLITILTFCLLVNTSFSQKIRTKSTFHKTPLSNTLLKIEEFDKNGNSIRKTECQDKKCKKREVHTLIYNNLGQLTEESIYTNKWGYIKLIWRREYTYYANGRLKTEIKINKNCSDGYDDYITYYYDSIGRLSMVYNKYSCFNKGYFNYPINYIYDSSNNLIEKIATYGDTSLIFYKHVYSYDINNNLVLDKYFYSYRDNLTISSMTDFKYDSLNRLILKRWISSPTYIDSTTYEYYNNGLIKSETKYPINNPYKKITWFENFYDENGNHVLKQYYFLNRKDKKVKVGKDLIKYKYFE